MKPGPPLRPTVFILGAGASADAGAPIMADFMERADDIRHRGPGSLFAEHFERVFRARNRLQEVFMKSSIRLDDVEELLSVFQLGHLLGRLGSVRSDDVERLPLSMRYVIAHTIERSIRYHVIGSRMPPVGSYRALAELIHVLRSHTDVAIMSFNYDVALEAALAVEGIPYDYLLSEKPQVTAGAVPLLKLHGSLNWCSRGAADLSEYDVLSHADARRVEAADERYHLEFGDLLVERGCLPVIVPPSWEKGTDRAGLARVWRAAANVLATAANIVVIGYSLREGDSFFRHLFALGTINLDQIIDRFILVDPQCARLQSKFMSILGSQIRDRDRFMTISGAFQAGVWQVAKSLGLPESTVHIIQTKANRGGLDEEAPRLVPQSKLAAPRA